MRHIPPLNICYTIDGCASDLPHGEMAAYELVIWLVLIEANTSPFRSQMWMVVSVDALIMNLPADKTDVMCFRLETKINPVII